jgi:hypothetical protein
MKRDIRIIKNLMLISLFLYEMDYKDFKDGLMSLSLVSFIFSVTFLMGVYILQYQTHLSTSDRDFIIILCIINVCFSLYYMLEATRLDKVFKMEDKHVLKFARRIGIITLIYSPHFFFMISLFFIGLHNMHSMMVFLIFMMEGILIGLVFKEVYDLLYVDEAKVKYELDKNRKRYLQRKGKPIPGIDY